MRFNSLAFRLFTTAAAWTLLVLPIAGIIIYGLYRDDVQASFDGQLQKLVNAISVDSMGAGAGPPTAPGEPLRAAVRGDALGLVLADFAARRCNARSASSPPRWPPARCRPPPPSTSCPIPRARAG